jgi:hypothetical protein
MTVEEVSPLSLVRLRGLPHAWGAGGSRRCLLGAVPGAARSAGLGDERGRDKDGDPARPERVTAEDVGQPVGSEIYAGGADDEGDEGRAGPRQRPAPVRGPLERMSANVA